MKSNDRVEFSTEKRLARIILGKNKKQKRTKRTPPKDEPQNTTLELLFDEALLLSPVRVQPQKKPHVVDVHDEDDATSGAETRQPAGGNFLSSSPLASSASALNLHGFSDSGTRNLSVSQVELPPVKKKIEERQNHKFAH